MHGHPHLAIYAADLHPHKPMSPAEFEVEGHVDPAPASLAKLTAWVVDPQGRIRFPAVKTVGSGQKNWKFKFKKLPGKAPPVKTDGVAYILVVEAVHTNDTIARSYRQFRVKE